MLSRSCNSTRHARNYLRVIVNEKPKNLEKTTSSVLSVLLLIYDLNHLDLDDLENIAVDSGPQNKMEESESKSHEQSKSNKH